MCVCVSICVPERITNYIEGGDADVSCIACMAAHHLIWRRHSHVSPTCRTDAGSGPPPLNSLTFRPVVGQLSEFVPFLLLEQRCGTACQAKLRRPRRCRCSRTGWIHTCSAAATKLSDFEWHFLFTARCCASAVQAMGLCMSVSVCLSVCLSQLGVLLKRLNVGSQKQKHTIAQGI